MNMTTEQVQVAIAAGLALTGPESDVSVPMKHASGAVILHQLLLAIGSGQVRLESDKPPMAVKPVAVKPPAAKKTARKKK